MYLREREDAGLSSRNPDYRGEIDGMLEYRLSNGQHDTYPESWALPESRVIQALEYFVEHLRSVRGTQSTYPAALAMSAVGVKADMALRPNDFRL
jgi:hypothetical protein